MKNRVFSGTRATGRLHLGNYFGAIKGYINLQNCSDFECLYMVVDLHSITTPFTPKTLKEYTKEVVLDYLGAGLDPQKASITLQSMVPEHIYLSWLFSSVVNVAKLSHLPTFKEKVKLHPEDVNLALLSYPVLMAADILLYKANLVPVGIDQEPHLEIAREIARKINNRFGTNFPEPQRFATPVNLVPSLNGCGKMSKSIKESTIYLTDSLVEIKKKISGIQTNNGKGNIKINKSGKQNVIEYYNEDGSLIMSLSSLFTLVELFQGEKQRKWYEDKYCSSEGVRYGDVKKSLSEAIYKELKPIQEKREYFVKQSKLVDKILLEGAVKAREIAQKTLFEIKEAYGFYQPK